MLTELEDLQESEESVWRTNMSIEIEARSNEGTELVHKEYTFSYSPEFDTWSFREYTEKRTPDRAQMSKRNWRKSRHIFWNDQETASIDVPPEISKELAKATGSESITIQVPAGTIDEPKYDEFTYESTE